MITLLSEIHFWTTQEDVIIKDTDYGSYKYFLKKEVAGTLQSQAKKQFCEQTGILYVPNNKRPEKLREKLKELEEHLLHNKIVYYCWDDNRLKLLLSTGLIVHLIIFQKTGDLVSIVFDKQLSVRLQVNIICDGVLFDSQVICVCNDGHLLGFGGPWKDGWVLEGGPRRRLHYYNDWLVVWGKAGVEHPQPWSPLAKDHQRANLHLYWIGARDPELLAYRKTEGEPLLVVVSKICDRTIIVVEQKVTQKGNVSVEVSNFELIINNLKRVSVTSVPLQTQISCCALSDNEERLLIGCIDGTLALLDRNRGSTRTVKAAFIATLASWHPQGVIVTVANEKGHLQYYDTALNCLKTQLSGEDCTPSTLLDLSGYFNTQFNIVSINWGPKDIVFSLEQGPLGLLTHVEGSLSFKSIAQRYIRLGKIDKAIKLLLSWEFSDKSFFVLQKITAHLLCKPITEEIAQHLQDALGSFHSPPAPLPSQIRHKFGHQVMSLTRRFFHQLVRASMFETAFLLAVDVGHHDLFMDLYYVAVKIGETEMAAAARAQASALLSRCSSEASNCSRSSCSQCSDSESRTSEENFERSPVGMADRKQSNSVKEGTANYVSSVTLNTENVLTTDFNQPNPTTYKSLERESKSCDSMKKSVPPRATYVKAPQVPSNYTKLSQSSVPSIPPLPFYGTMGMSYIQQYAENTINPSRPNTNNISSNSQNYSGNNIGLPPYQTLNSTNLTQVNSFKSSLTSINRLAPPPLPVIPSASNAGLSKSYQNLTNDQHYQTSSSSFNPSTSREVPNLISFDNNLISFDNPSSFKTLTNNPSTLTKKNQPKVKFSDTVTAFIVPEVKRPVRPPLPPHLTDPRRELAESLPLCHPNEDYLKDFAPIRKEEEKENDEDSAQPPKIKVVHFGVV